jgi:protein-disulfide isomerase
MAWSGRSLGVLGALVIVLASCRAADPPRAALTPTRTPLARLTPDPARKLPPPGRTKGNPDAPVTLVVYADFQCPYSRQFAREVLPRLDDEYLKPGKTSFTYKYFPVIDQGRIGESHWAAYAAQCANEQGRFWEYHDQLYAEPRGANVGAFTRDNLKLYAVALQLDLAQFNQCLDSDRYAALILDHLVEALQLKLPGTPTFLLNGRKMDTPTLDYTEFWKPLEAEIKAR